MTLEIVPCRLAHLRSIAPRLRAEERLELEELGEAPRHALFKVWRETIDPRAAVMDGQTIAVWGDAAPPLAGEGLLWLMTAAAVERIPITFARVAKAEAERMLTARATLRSSVHLSCTRSLRFYRMLGFEIFYEGLIPGFLGIRISR